MCSVFDVAKYVLETLNQDITTMKLQKLVYYCQAWSLVWDEKPLFDEDFEAWANGPVCPELFGVHKGKFTIGVLEFAWGDSSYLKEEQRETINSVIDYYGNKTPHWLSTQTHNEAPWKNARDGYSSGELCKNIITKESMMEYYGSF